MSILAKRKYDFSLSWPPILVLGIILIAGLLLGGRYRFFSPSAAVLLLGIAASLAIYTFYAENHSKVDQALVATALLVASVTVVQIVGVTHLLTLLFSGAQSVRGTQLLASGVYFWACNVLTFALWYWLIDRGGPHVRARRSFGRAEFFFPEMAAGDFAIAKWTPGLTEYMYLAFTNATAFSPTDTLPLSSRARLLMTVESGMSLIIIALVAARAVNILTS